MKPSTIKSMTGIIASILLPLSAHSQTYDATLGFSTTSNPANPWRYGRESTLGGAFSLLGSYSIANNQMKGWGDSSTFCHVLRNTTGSPVQDGGTVYPAFGLEMHPGSNETLAFSGGRHRIRGSFLFSSALPMFRPKMWLPSMFTFSATTPLFSTTISIRRQQPAIPPLHQPVGGRHHRLCCRIRKQRQL